MRSIRVCTPVRHHGWVRVGFLSQLLALHVLRETFAVAQAPVVCSVLLLQVLVVLEEINHA